MAGLLEDLATISESLQDDLEGVDAEQGDYPDQLPPAPPLEGNYKAKINFLGGLKDQSGNLKFQVNEKGDKFPTLVYSAVIVEPVEQEGIRLFAFEPIYTKPFTRDGKSANSLMDLTRAFDSERKWTRVTEGIELLKELAETSTFRCRIRWEAYDSEYANELKANKLVDGPLTNDHYKAIRKEVTIMGMKRFDQDANGKPLPRVKHPVSGNILVPRAKLSQLFPSHQEGIKIN